MPLPGLPPPEGDGPGSRACWQTAWPHYSGFRPNPTPPLRERTSASSCAGRALRHYVPRRSCVARTYGARDTRPQVLEKAVRFLEVSQPRSFTEPFVETWLAVSAPEVRVATLKLLESYGTREVVPLILPLLKDPASSVRAEAARVLGSLVAQYEAWEQLQELLMDPAAVVREEVRKAMLTMRNATRLEVPAGEEKK